MQLIALALTIVAGIAQTIGVLLLVARARAATRLLNLGAHRVLDGGDPFGHSVSTDLSDVASFLLRDAASTWWAIALILLGIASATIASVLTLIPA